MAYEVNLTQVNDTPCMILLIGSCGENEGARIKLEGEGGGVMIGQGLIKKLKRC